MAEGRRGQATFEWAGQRGEPYSPGSERRARPATPPASGATSQPRASLPPDDELWDVTAAARFLGRSVSWVYHRAEDGTLPVRRLAGWGVRFIPSELRAWVESGGGGRGR